MDIQLIKINTLRCLMKESKEQGVNVVVDRYSEYLSVITKRLILLQSGHVDTDYHFFKLFDYEVFMRTGGMEVPKLTFSEPQKRRDRKQTIFSSFVERFNPSEKEVNPSPSAFEETKDLLNLLREFDFEYYEVYFSLFLFACTVLNQYMELHPDLQVRISAVSTMLDVSARFLRTIPTAAVKAIVSPALFTMVEGIAEMYRTTEKQELWSEILRCFPAELRYYAPPALVNSADLSYSAMVYHIDRTHSAIRFTTVIHSLREQCIGALHDPQALLHQLSKLHHFVQVSYLDCATQAIYKDTGREFRVLFCLLHPHLFLNNTAERGFKLLRKQHEPFPEILQFFSDVSQLEDDFFVVYLKEVMTELLELFSKYFFVWEESTKKASLCCLRHLARFFNVTHTVHPITEEQGSRSSDTFLEGPLLEILTTAEESVAVRLAALELMGSLGALNPDAARAKFRSKSSTAEDFFGSFVLLAKDEIFRTSSIQVKSSLEHSGFVRGIYRSTDAGGDGFALPKVPGDEGFELTVVLTTFLAVLSVEAEGRYSVDTQSTVVSSLTEICCELQTELRPYRFGIYEVVLTRLLWRGKVEPTLCSKLFLLLAALTLTKLEEDTDLLGLAPAINKVIEVYFTENISSTLVLLETYLKLGFIRVLRSVCFVKTELCKVLEHSASTALSTILKVLTTCAHEFLDADIVSCLERIFVENRHVEEILVLFCLYVKQSPTTVLSARTLSKVEQYKRGGGQRSLLANALLCSSKVLPEHLPPTWVSQFMGRRPAAAVGEGQQESLLRGGFKLRKVSIIEVEKLIELLEEETVVLKSQSVNRDICFEMEEERRFIKLFCSSLLSRNSKQFLRSCAESARISHFVAEEVINIALASIWKDARDFDSQAMRTEEGESPRLEERLASSFVDMFQYRPSRKYILLDLFEYCERGGMMLHFRPEYIADLAASEGLFAKAVRLYESGLRQALERKDFSTCFEIYSKLKPIYLRSAMDLQLEGLKTYLINIASEFNFESVKTEEEEENHEFPIRNPSILAIFKSIQNCVKVDVEQVRSRIEQGKAECLWLFLRQRSKSYQGLYNLVIMTQQLAELDEVLVIKENQKRLPVEEVEKQMRKTHKIWSKRLLVLRPAPITWFQILPLHLLVFDFEQDLSAWLKLSVLCRKHPAKSNQRRSAFILSKLGVSKQCLSFNEEIVSSESLRQELKRLSPHTAFEYLKLAWSRRKSCMRSGEVRAIQELVIQGLDQVANAIEGENSVNDVELKRLKLRCLLKHANCLMKVHFIKPTRRKVKSLKSLELKLESEQREILETIRTSIERCLRIDNENFKVWNTRVLFLEHSLEAESYSEVNMSSSTYLAAIDLQKRASSKELQTELLIESGVKCIQIGEAYNIVVLTNCLKILTLWCELKVELAVRIGKKIFTDKKLGSCLTPWLTLIPQLFSYLRIVPTEMKVFLKWLLVKLGENYLSSIVFQLFAAISNRDSTLRSEIEEVVQRLELNPVLKPILDDAKLLIRELTNVAIFPQERWHYTLNKASKYFFGTKKNPEKMIKIFDSLAEEFYREGPRTTVETNFYKLHGAEIETGLKKFKEFKLSRSQIAATEMWDVFTGIFRECEKMLPQVKSFKLKAASPYLNSKKHFKVAVPGTVVPGRSEVITILEIREHIQVLGSKQRPRKIDFVGSNGKIYTFLLKAYEDLRQDERLMQFFGFVSNLLKTTKRGKAMSHTIARYPIIPLSTEVGLAGWVLRANTLHSLVGDYRKKRKIPIDAELKLYLNFTTFEQESVETKTVFFQKTVEIHKGMDLAQAMLLQSETSGVWLSKRNTYTVSHAVMSVVSYVLGIGDRHPSNIMIGHDTGTVLHIDFGDCFESAMLRDVKPELVQMRLTKMMVQAMGPQGVEGLFRKTCEHALKVLRKNKNLVMAMLNTFLHDPLLDWWQEEELKPQKALIKNKFKAVNMSSSASKSTASAPKQQNEVGVEHIQMIPIKKSKSNAAIALAPDLTKFELLKPGNVTEILFIPATGILYSQHTLNGNKSKFNLELEKDRLVRQSSLQRVLAKLSGNDFDEEGLSVEDQISKVIAQAMEPRNLSQMYLGWCPFW